MSEDEKRKMVLGHPVKMDVSEALEGLVELHDSRPVFLSITRSTGPDRGFFQRRLREVEKLLPKAEREILLRNMELAQPMLGNQREAMAVFVSVPHDLYVAVTLPQEIGEERLVVDTSPYIRDLARTLDDWESYLLVVSDETSAVIELVEVGKEKKLTSSSKDIMHRHKKGGMSQRRYQRLRAGAVDHFLKDVAEDVTAADAECKVKRIVLAGPGNGKKMLLERFPQHIQEKVIGLVDVDEDQGDPVASSLEVYLREELDSEESIMSEFRSAVMRGNASYGAAEVAEMVYQGRARLLLVLHGLKTPGWRCEKCGMIGKGGVDSCPLCSGGVASVDLVEEILEEAVKKDTPIEFIHESPFLEEVGGLGVFLRY